MRRGSSAPRLPGPAVMAVMVVAALARGAGSAAAGGPAVEERLVIVQPGYPGSTEEAREFVAGLARAITGAGGPAVASGEYHNDEKAGLEAIHKTDASLGIVSLGFYLEHRERLALEPVAWSRPDEPFHVVVAAGKFAKLAELAGKKVTGTPLGEPEFVHRVLFGGESAPPAGAGSRSWKAEPARFFSRAVRDVSRGRADAVLLSDREYRGVKKLPSAEKLEAIHATKAFPTAVVVALGKDAAARAAAGLAKALEGMAKTEEGKELLETMGIEGFGKVDMERLAALEKLYGEAAGAARGE